MPLPLLGLLALGGAAFASPYASNRNAQIRGDYLQRRADEAGIDLQTATPDMLGAFGAQTGLIGLPDLLGDRRTGFEGVENRAAAMARQQASIGAANMRHQMTLAQNQQQFEMEQEAKYTTMTPYQRAQLDVQGYNAETQRMTAQSRMNQIQAEMAADTRAQQQAREAELEQNANVQTRIDESLRVIKEAKFDDPAWRSQNEELATQYINQTMEILQNEFFRGTLGRTDAPGDSEMETLRPLFQRVEEEGFFRLESAARQQVLAALLLARQRMGQARQQIEARATGQPFVPSFVPPELSGEGFTPDG